MIRMLPNVTTGCLLLFLLTACTITPHPRSITQSAPVDTSVLARDGSPTGIDKGHLSRALRMNVPRAAHTATQLADGRILIAGGFRPEGRAEIAIASAEIYDPTTNTFAPTNDLHEARSGHTATLLPNRQVLLAGGWGVDGRLATAELYDPQTGQFQLAARMSTPRASMTATLLPNGQVLFAGGDWTRNRLQPVAERYDPATNTFVASGTLHKARAGHTATLLPDGTVLLIGGRSADDTVLASAERYDPRTDRFTDAGELHLVRHKHAAVLLPDGNVLVIGGSDQLGWTGQYTSAELYQVRTGTSSPVSNRHRERFKLTDAALLLANGNVLIGGGNRQLEIFDTQNQHFVRGEQLDNDYYFSVVTPLQGRRVLITGGYDTAIQPSAKAWLYYY